MGMLIKHMSDKKENEIKLKFKANSNYNVCHKIQSSLKFKQASEHILFGIVFRDTGNY